MVIRMFVVFSAILLLVCSARGGPKPGQAKECTVTERDLYVIEAALQKATSCENSMATFEACAYGASGDVRLGQAVISRCEGDFLSTLNVSQKRAYERELERCWRKYRRKSGTMYRSFEAMCAAAVAQAYSRRFLKAGRAKKKK